MKFKDDELRMSAKNILQESLKATSRTASGAHVASHLRDTETSALVDSLNALLEERKICPAQAVTALIQCAGVILGAIAVYQDEHPAALIEDFQDIARQELGVAMMVALKFSSALEEDDEDEDDEPIKYNA